MEFSERGKLTDRPFVDEWKKKKKKKKKKKNDGGTLIKVHDGSVAVT